MKKRGWLGFYLLQGTLVLMLLAFPFVVGEASIKLLGDRWFLPVTLMYGALWLNQGRLLGKWHALVASEAFFAVTSQQCLCPFGCDVPTAAFGSVRTERPLKASEFSQNIDFTAISVAFRKSKSAWEEVTYPFPRHN